MRLQLIRKEDLNIHPDYIKYFKINDNNVRCTDEYFNQLHEDIKEFGINVPIIVNDTTSYILDGVIRFKIARMLGFTSIPCFIYSIKLPEEEIKMLLRLQYFNKSIDNHEWNNGLELYYAK